MAFKPRGNGGSNRPQGEFKERPAPKDGARPARVSLIIDLGKQEREDFEDTKTGEKRPQKPCQQVAIFCDLVNDKVDYGGDIGVQQYRLNLHREFAGKPEGINFQAVPPKDGEGNMLKVDVKNGPWWGLPGASVITKLCKAVGRPDVAVDKKKPESLDLEQLLGLPFMAQVEVKRTEKGEGDEKRVYVNVNFKGSSPIPLLPVMDAEGEPTGEEKPMAVAKLGVPAKLIGFDNATKEDIQLIRYALRQKIKLALDYPGSQMQKAIQEWEAENLSQNEDSGEEAPAPTPAPAPVKPKQPKKVETPKAPAAEEGEEEFSDTPF